jgi:hypothetical protein
MEREKILSLLETGLTYVARPKGKPSPKGLCTNGETTHLLKLKPDCLECKEDWDYADFNEYDDYGLNLALIPRSEFESYLDNLIKNRAAKAEFDSKRKTLGGTRTPETKFFGDNYGSDEFRDGKTTLNAYFPEDNPKHIQFEVDMAYVKMNFTLNLAA